MLKYLLYHFGGLAQLGEHLPYKQRVGGSIPSASTIFFNDAGWSSSVARRAHNPKVTGSNPVPAIVFISGMELWCRGLTCLPVTQEIAGSNPVSSAIFVLLGSVAQSVEQRTENPRVGGSIPSRATILIISYAVVAQLVEQLTCNQ